jgi:hypothetical protein
MTSRPRLDLAARTHESQFHRKTTSESCVANKQIKRAVLPPRA